MLDLFPIPYPNEWWYSVLCRFGVRMTMLSSRYIQTLLGHNMYRPLENAFYPTNTLAQTIKKLPQPYPDICDILVNHTLLKSLVRLFPIQAKENVLHCLCMGTLSPNTLVSCAKVQMSSEPKYCPCCMQEDIASYGEAYWHIEHQHSLMQICLKHHCRLYTLDDKTLQKFRQGYDLIPLNGVSSLPPDFTYHQWEERISHIAYDYWSMPFNISPPSHNNIIQALNNQGYGRVYATKNAHCVEQQLANALIERYNNAIIQKYYLAGLSKKGLIRCVSWNWTTAEPYIILQDFVGLSTQQVFTDTKIPDKLERQLRTLESKWNYTLAQLAKKTKLFQSDISKACAKYNIAPFWDEAVRARNWRYDISLTKTQQTDFILYCNHHNITPQEFIQQHIVQTVYKKEGEA